MTIAEILDACLTTGDESAWLAFIARFQPLIASSIYRVASRYATPNPALVDDLVQETYLRLCRDNCRNLRNFQAQHDEAIFGYIKVVAVSVALDYFRTRTTLKRQAESDEASSDIEASISAGSIEQSALLSQLEQRLQSTQSERDCTVFWLYYKQGYTAKDIASIPCLGLSQKGVESCIYRLTQFLRETVAAGRGQSFSGKGNPPQTTLGVVK